MLFDDRLATVLRSEARSEGAARTQFRQLVDLIGSMPSGVPPALAQAAYDRLGALADELSAQAQSAILREPGLRLRNREMIAWLARGEPQAAAAAMATARPSEDDWLYLIPRLPITARGFLRHRRDLPQSAKRTLERLGVGDLVLPRPEREAIAPEEDHSNRAEMRQADRPAARPLAPPTGEQEPGIAALVRRIEAFREARAGASAATPQLPLEDEREVPRCPAFDFSSDATGTISWAEPSMAPLAVGLSLHPAHLDATAELDAASARAMTRRQPVRNGRVTIAGISPIEGIWRIDATPHFSPATGSFAGYHGRLRRERSATAPTTESSSEHDRMRQLLHELRTPVNAVQGFAEIIQQQLFGPAPNEYRALAAAIAVDAARLLAGFDEIDRLAKLETGALEMETGRTDLAAILDHILRRLEGALRPRGARIEWLPAGREVIIGIAESDALQLIWRALATLAGALGPGERIALDLVEANGTALLRAELPAALADNADLLTASTATQPRAVSAGMFGVGFTLRLARAEAVAAGGSLRLQNREMLLGLPCLTRDAPGHSVDEDRKSEDVSDG